MSRHRDGGDGESMVGQNPASGTCATCPYHKSTPCMAFPALRYFLRLRLFQAIALDFNNFPSLSASRHVAYTHSGLYISLDRRITLAVIHAMRKFKGYTAPSNIF